MSSELNYKISNWNELPQCLSNNSKDLRLAYFDIHDKELDGKLIQVTHKKYGVLSSFLIECDGVLLSSYNNEDNFIHEFTPEEILEELCKFGFNIIYEPEKHLDGDQLDYLMSIQKLGYDKIRLMTIVRKRTAPGQRQCRTVLVAFNTDKHLNWCYNTYQCPEYEFLNALNDGSATNLTEISKKNKFNWAFMEDYVLNIDDILESNA